MRSRRRPEPARRPGSQPSRESRAAPDIVCVLNNWAQLYGESLTDVSDIAEEIGKAQGGFYETSKTVANDGSKWIALPWCIVGLQIAYRKSWFAEIGYADGKFPQTWDEYREAGKKKAKNRPIGQTLGHTFGDAPAFAYPYLWSLAARRSRPTARRSCSTARRRSQKGFSVGPTTDWEKHKLWDDDPIMLPYKQAARTGRFAGYQGPSTRRAAEVVTKYILTDMYAKAVQGMAAEDAVKWAHTELAKIYGS